LNDSFDSVESCFDIVAVFGNNVAGFGNNVEGNFVLSTKSKQIERVQFVSTLSKGLNFTIESFDIVAVCGNKVECCFDNVAGVDGALRRLMHSFASGAAARGLRLALTMALPILSSSQAFYTQ